MDTPVATNDAGLRRAIEILDAVIAEHLEKLSDTDDEAQQKLHFVKQQAVYEARRKLLDEARETTVYPEIEAIPYGHRLAVAEQVFEAINKHMQEGGSYRYLIYERLKFHEDAYVPLFHVGGLEISNACNDIADRMEGLKK